MVTLAEHLMYFLNNGCNKSFPSSRELQEYSMGNGNANTILTCVVLFAAESFHRLYESVPVHVLALQVFLAKQ